MFCACKSFEVPPSSLILNPCIQSIISQCHTLLSVPLRGVKEQSEHIRYGLSSWFRLHSIFRACIPGISILPAPPQASASICSFQGLAGLFNVRGGSWSACGRACVRSLGVIWAGKLGGGLREMKWFPSLDLISKLWEVGEPFPTSGPSVPTDPSDSHRLI